MDTFDLINSGIGLAVILALWLTGPAGRSRKGRH